MREKYLLKKPMFAEGTRDPDLLRRAAVSDRFSAERASFIRNEPWSLFPVVVSKHLAGKGEQMILSTFSCLFLSSLFEGGKPK